MSSAWGLLLDYPVELICIYDFGVQYRTVQYRDCAYRARLIQEEPEGNCVVSPAKISLASRQGGNLDAESGAVVSKLLLSLPRPR